MADSRIGISVDGDGNVIRDNTINIDARQKSPERTGSEPPNNLGNLGVARDRFFGRDATLRELHDRLGQCDRVAVTSVAGMGGVGKSELAVQYARQFLQGSYRGGVVWLSAERAGLELLSFARSQFFPDVDFSQFGDLAEQLAFCWARWPVKETPPESVLLVFDDVTDYRSQVADLLPNDKRFRVLVTTRQQIQGIGALDLDVLDPADALALLVSIVGEARVAAEAETAAVLCDWLGYLPLGVELAGYYLQRKPNLSLAKLMERLQAKRLDAKALVNVPDAMTARLGVASAFELSWEQLAAEAQAVAMRLSLFAAAPIPWELMAGCYGEVDEEDLEDWRGALVGLHLVRDVSPELTEAAAGVPSPERYRLHPLIREFFAAKLRDVPEEQGTAWRHSFVDAVLQDSESISQTMNLTEVAQFEPSLPHLIELAAQFDTAEFAEKSARACGALFVFYYAQGLFDRAQSWSERALDICERQLGSDHPETAASLNNLANLYQSQVIYE